MNTEFIRDALRWLIGGGAVAVATLLGTTAYQQGQLKIEREKNLRQFLDKYVEIAVNGTLDERIRFVSYWESLEVSDRIGVDFARYREALRNEIETELVTAEAQAQVAMAAPVRIPFAPSGPPRDPQIQEAPPPEAEPTAEPVASAPPPAPQIAYYESRKSSVERLAAPDLERQGFEALLARDGRAALDAFTRATKLWPDYHNVAEIEKHLQDALPELSDPKSPRWKQVYKTILEDWSWGMPPDLRSKMAAAAR